MGGTFAFCGREVLMRRKASSVMVERLRFLARLLDGEAMTDMCRDFGIAWFDAHHAGDLLLL